MSQDKKRIMISYGHKDATGFVQELNNILTNQGHYVWIDRSKEENAGIDGGSAWETEIEKAIEDNDIVIAVLSPHAIRRPDGVCLDEISMARFENKFIIPLMYKEVKPPLCIFRLDWIDFLRSETQISARDSGLKKLSRSIENNKLDYEGKNKAFSALKSINFDYRLTGLRQEFIGRKWIYDTENPNSESLIEDWLKSEKNILLILGDPGVGKSAISAHLIEKHPACIAYHFCISDDEDTLNPNKFIKSIAHQLATQLGDSYSDQVLKEMSELPKSPTSLFRTLISNPISQLPNSDNKKYFIVIDGLDEASKNGSNNELLKLFSTKFINALPDHIRFVFTSRRNRDIESRFATYSPFKIETTEQNNILDIKEYAFKMLDRHSINISPDDVDVLIEKSQGSILYIKEIIKQAINSEGKTIDVESLPEGLDGIYLEFFENSFDNYDPYREILSVLVATYSPLTLTLLEILVTQGDLKRKYAILQEYFPLNSKDEVTVFHKSLLDWLKKTTTNRYSVDEHDGHKMIVNSNKLNLNDENELRIYLFSASKLFLHKQTYRDEDISEFYDNKIVNELDKLIENSDNILLLDSLKKLIKDYPDFKENEYNEKMFKKLDSLFAPEVDIADGVKSIVLNRLEKLYEADNEKWTEDYTGALINLSTFYRNVNETSKAIELGEKSLDILETSYQNNQDRWAENYTATLNSLALSYKVSNKISKAIELEEKNLKILEKNYKDNPDRWAEDYVGALRNLGTSYKKINHLNAAIELEKNSLSIAETLYQENSDRWADLYTGLLIDLGVSYKISYRPNESIKLYEKSLFIIGSRYKEDPSNWAESYVRSLVNLGLLYKSTNEIVGAIKLLEESRSIQKPLYEKNPERWAKQYTVVLINLAIVYKENNEIKKAIKLEEECLTIREKLYEKNPDRWAEHYTLVLMTLGTSYSRVNRLDEAVKLQQESLSIRKSLYEGNQDRWLIFYSGALSSLAKTYSMQNNFEDAMDLLVEKHNILQQAYGNDDTKTKEVLEAVSDIKKKMKG